MDPISLTITIIFICIVLYITIAGFWPLSKAFGLSGLCPLWVEAEQIKKQIKEAIQKLPAANTAEEQRNKFTMKYNEINSYFKNDQSIFSHLWLEFTEQLIEPSDKEIVFQNSIRPEKFFTLEHFLKQKNINLKLIESMPGILVGIGVLGTFIGLSISLIPALDKLQGDPSGAVAHLIGGAGVAFFTSVAGLLCSLVFNVVSDKKTAVLQIQLNEFNSRLEKSLKFITEERLLTMHLEEARQQAKHLSSMDENIALKIGDIMRDSIEQMGGKLQQIIAQNNQTILEKFLNDMASQMTKGLGDFSRKQLESSEKTMSSLQDNIPLLLSRLENSQKQNEEAAKNLISLQASSSQESQDHINESLIRAMRGMKGEFEEITQNLKEGMNQALSDSSTELKNLISNIFEKSNELLKETEESKKSFQRDMDQTADKLQAFSESLNKITFELSSAAAPKIQSAAEKFSEAAEQQKQITEKNERHIQSLDNLSKEIKEMSFSALDIMEKSSDFIEQINQSNESLKKSWGDYEKRFSYVDESAEKLFKEISEGLELVSTKSAEYVDSLGAQSTQMSNNLAASVEELREAIPDLSEALNKNQMLSNFAVSVEELRKAVSDLSEALSKK